MNGAATKRRSTQMGVKLCYTRLQKAGKKKEEAGKFSNSHRSLSVSASSPKFGLVVAASAASSFAGSKPCREEFVLPSLRLVSAPMLCGLLTALLLLASAAAAVAQEGGVGAAIPAKDPAKSAQQCNTSCQSSTPLVSSSSLFLPPFAPLLLLPFLIPLLLPLVAPGAAETCSAKVA